MTKWYIKLFKNWFQLDFRNLLSLGWSISKVNYSKKVCILSEYSIQTDLSAIFFFLRLQLRCTCTIKRNINIYFKKERENWNFYSTIASKVDNRLSIYKSWMIVCTPLMISSIDLFISPAAPYLYLSLLRLSLYSFKLISISWRKKKRL